MLAATCERRAGSRRTTVIIPAAGDVRLMKASFNACVLFPSQTHGGGGGGGDVINYVYKGV